MIDEMAKKAELISLRGVLEVLKKGRKNREQIIAILEQDGHPFQPDLDTPSNRQRDIGAAISQLKTHGYIERDGGGKDLPFYITKTGRIMLEELATREKAQPRIPMMDDKEELQVSRQSVREMRVQQAKEALIFRDDEPKRAELGVLTLLKNTDAEHTLTKSNLAQQLWPRLLAPRPHAVPRGQVYAALERLCEAGHVAKLQIEHDIPAAQITRITSTRYHITETGKERLQALQQEAEALRQPAGGVVR